MNRIDANDYEQLLLLTWDRQDKTMTEEEAFALYQAKDKWVEPENMDAEELAFFKRLVDIYGNGVFLRKPSPMRGPLNNYGEDSDE
ncbi:MAG: hypothetical protein U1C96_07205 [Gallionella sp.]|nr:hypothetical protein [Gallionella sp.]